MFEITTLLTSVGFLLALTNLIGGWRVIRNADLVVEARMHRLNGFLTLFIYLVLASLALSGGMIFWSTITWGAGLTIYLVKIWIVHTGKAYTYGSLLGSLLLILWFILIYTHMLAL